MLDAVLVNPHNAALGELRESGSMQCSEKLDNKGKACLSQIGSL